MLLLQGLHKLVAKNKSVLVSSDAVIRVSIPNTVPNSRLNDAFQIKHDAQRKLEYYSRDRSFRSHSGTGYHIALFGRGELCALLGPS
jgi:hypothetical protein